MEPGWGALTGKLKAQGNTGGGGAGNTGRGMGAGKLHGRPFTGPSEATLGLTFAQAIPPRLSTPSRCPLSPCGPGLEGSSQHSVGPRAEGCHTPGHVQSLLEGQEWEPAGSLWGFGHPLRWSRRTHSPWRSGVQSPWPWMTCERGGGGRVSEEQGHSGTAGPHEPGRDARSWAWAEQDT